MSKAATKGGRMMKKVLPKVDHSSKLKVNIPAGLANARPPLGSQLGQRNINIANFCNDFNQKTAHIKDGVPLPTRVEVKADGTYNLVIYHPPATYFLKQAAGIKKGQVCKGEVAGKITFKHLYEIACVKSEDPSLALMNLEQVCRMLIGIARTCGIQVVRTLDPVEHAEFMKLRQENVERIEEERRLNKEIKMLRTG